ncbi:ankyrin repeat-containing domain protein [Zopfochytrium polystomum]|nr:ankyrin repeat-containing domain protein [Zopfochytrium polystomum]
MCRMKLMRRNIPIRLDCLEWNLSATITSITSRTDGGRGGGGGGGGGFPLLQLPGDIVSRIGLFCDEHRLAFPTGAFNRRLRTLFSHPLDIASRAWNHYAAAKLASTVDFSLRQEESIQNAALRGEAAHAAADNVAVLLHLIRHATPGWNIRASLSESIVTAAARHGNAAAVRLFASHGADVGDDGGRALIEAGRHAHTDAIAACLEVTAAESAARYPGQTRTPQSALDSALDLACRHATGGVAARSLIAAGADVDGRDGGAVISAVLFGGDEMLRMLLVDYGANVRSEDGDVVRAGVGGVALCSLPRTASRRMVELLLDAGADAAGVRHAEALKNAAGKGCVDAVQVLVERTRPDRRAIAAAAAEAARNGCGAVIECLIEMTGDAALPASFRASQLFALAKKGHWDILLPSLRSRSHDMVSTAAITGNVDTIKLLLELEPDKAWTEARTTSYALSEAARSGSVGAVELLLESLATCSDLAPAMRDALLSAVRDRHVPVAQLLLARGADSKRSDKILQAAVVSGSEELVALLIDRGYSPSLLDAAQVLWSVKPRIGRRQQPPQGKLLPPGLLRLLLDHGFETDAVDFESLTDALGDPESSEVAAILLAQPNGRGAAFRRALFRKAAERRNAELLERLLGESGGDGDGGAFDLGGALLEASKNGDLNSVKLLLRHGAGSDESITREALLRGIHGHFRGIVKLFLGRCGGAAVSADVLAAAVRSGSGEMVRLVLDGGNVPARLLDRELMNAARSRPDVLQLLLERGADVHVDSDVSLVMAAAFGKSVCVKMLLEHGADPRARDGEALKLATRSEYTECVKLLKNAMSDQAA